jgi:hypothetical protein
MQEEAARGTSANNKTNPCHSNGAQANDLIINPMNVI